MSDEKPSLGFIGIGLMGQPMTQRLLDAGYQVTVWNRTPEKLKTVLSDGAIAAATPAEVAAKADIVMQCVMDAPAVETVVFGADGIVEAADDTKILVDFTSAAPDATQAMAARLKSESGMGWIDAPVSGGVAGAEAGQLAIFAGGDAADIDRARPVLDHLAVRVTHFGPSGSGQIAKLCNQLIVGANLTVISEAIHLAEKGGIDATKLPEALKGGFADSGPLQIFGTRFAARQSEPVVGHVASMLKDLDTAISMCRSLDTELPVAEAARDRLRVLADQGKAEEDIGVLMDLFPSTGDAAN